MNDLRALLGAVAIPLAETIEQTPNGGRYVRFLAHLVADRRLRDLLIARGPEAGPLQDIFRALRRLRPELPELIWNERLRLVARGIINALAEREGLCAANDPEWCALSNPVFVSNLIDVGVAVLTAPVSVDTLAKFALDDRAMNEGEMSWHKQPSLPDQHPRPIPSR